MCSLLTSQTFITPHLDICSEFSSPHGHVLLKTLLPTWAKPPLPHPLQSFWIPWAAQAVVTASLHQFRLCWELYKNAHAKLSANFILFLVFTAYDYGKTKTKAKEEEGWLSREYDERITDTKKKNSSVFQLYLPIKILLKIHKGYFSGKSRIQKR